MTTTCPECGRNGRVSDDAAGREIRCKCGARFTAGLPIAIRTDDEDEPVPAPTSALSEAEYRSRMLEHAAYSSRRLLEIQERTRKIYGIVFWAIGVPFLLAIAFAPVILVVAFLSGLAQDDERPVTRAELRKMLGD